MNDSSICYFFLAFEMLRISDLNDNRIWSTKFNSRISRSFATPVRVDVITYVICCFSNTDYHFIKKSLKGK